MVTTTAEETRSAPPVQPSGYETQDKFYATRFTQGGRQTYLFDLSLVQADSLLPMPDPDVPAPGNRRINLAHAKGFGRYVRDNPDWIAPGLLFRVPSKSVSFEVREEISGSSFGILSIPRLARTKVATLDGQHRLLGIHYGLEEINAELEKNRARLANARRDHDDNLVKHFSSGIKQLEQQLRRFEGERIPVQIAVESSSEMARQLFVDIADNALGITATIRARFDSRKILNRVLNDLLTGPLLSGKIDPEHDRLGPSSPFLMAAKQVVELVRVVIVGLDGRIGRRFEAETKDIDVREKANEFFGTLAAGFPDMFTENPVRLRSHSLLSSLSMHRVLAGVYRELTKAGWSQDDIVKFFQKLDPLMEGPVDSDSIWLTTGMFAIGSMAPSGGRDKLSLLIQIVTGWAKAPDQLPKVRESVKESVA